MPKGTVQLVAPTEALPRDAVIINLATGEPVGSVEAIKSGENLEMRGVPISRDPLLITTRDCLQQTDVEIRARNVP